MTTRSLPLWNENGLVFAAAQSTPFTFYKGKELVVTTWFALPDRLYDDPEELAEWARAAHRVAGVDALAAKEAAQLDGAKFVEEIVEAVRIGRHASARRLSPA